jgi:hypothetical protein
MAQDPSEVPYPVPTHRSLSYYFVLLVLVAPLWSSVPLSWAFVLYSLRSGKIWSFSWPGHLLFILTLFEVGSDTTSNPTTYLHNISLAGHLQRIPLPSRQTHLTSCSPRTCQLLRAPICVPSSSQGRTCQSPRRLRRRNSECLPTREP